MKVLLINPPYSATERYGKDLGKLGPTSEPLGLAYVAASLECAGYHVKIIDAPALRLQTTDLIFIATEEHYDIIGVTMLTPMYGRSIEIIKALKTSIPRQRIVVGGPHPTILPHDTLKENPEIDFAIVGEGEHTMVELLNAIGCGISLDNVKGVVFRQGEEIHFSGHRPYIKNLDEIPLPARHLLPMDSYKITASRSMNAHSYSIIIARGCPFRCAFCSHTFGRTFRHYSVERILEEIEFLKEAYHATELNFEADTLTLNKNFLKDLCQGIIDAGYNKQIRWTCESRVDTVDKDLLTIMREAGCWQISYGVESGSQRLLDLINKDITLEQIEHAFKITKQVGISIRAFFMLGLPTETKKESYQTIAFAKKLDADWSQFTITVPYPGTHLFELAKSDGALLSMDWNNYKTWGGWTNGQVAYVPSGRTPDELKRTQRKALRTFYLRPRIIYRFLKNLRLFNLKKYFMGAYVLIKSYIKDFLRLS